LWAAAIEAIPKPLIFVNGDQFGVGGGGLRGTPDLTGIVDGRGLLFYRLLQQAVHTDPHPPEAVKAAPYGRW
jgi:hypothetical protein